MDCAPNVNIFRELQVVHDTGYFSSQVSPEEDWQQVINHLFVGLSVCLSVFLFVCCLFVCFISDSGPLNSVHTHFGAGLDISIEKRYYSKPQSRNETTFPNFQIIFFIIILVTKSHDKQTTYIHMYGIYSQLVFRPFTPKRFGKTRLIFINCLKACNCCTLMDIT